MIHGVDVATGNDLSGNHVNALGNTTDDVTNSRGNSNANTTDRVWNHFTDLTSTNKSFYALSQLLTVQAVGAGSTYASWQTANSTAQAINLDHDNDGVTNGVEYFLGGSTNTTGFTALPGVTNTAGTLSVTFTKAASYSGVYGTDYVVQTSATLAAGSWVDETLGGNVTISGNDVIYTFPGGTKNFVRLNITGP